VREMREAWPGQSVAAIHTTALEVGTALLHRGDIEIGELVNGKFVPTKSAPWQANERMVSDLKASKDLFENEPILKHVRRSPLQARRSTHGP